MEPRLSPIGARILGALIEKEMTTPDYYPLTLNALLTACNQKSNREPVMSLDEDSIVPELDVLRERRIVFQVRAAGSRALKYEHNLGAIADFSPREAAVLCVLLLRGPQTPGQIRNRTTRLYAFNGLSEVERALAELAEKPDGPFVRKLPRQAGHKEHRYAELLSDSPVPEETPEPVSAPPTESAAPEPDRLAGLEETVSVLQSDLEELRAEFERFRSQFE
jgi:uncharacterized protein